MVQRLEKGSLLNGGMVTGLPGFALGRNESPNAINIDPANPLGAVTRPGSSQYGSGLAAASGFKGYGIFPWQRNLGTKFVFAALGTSIYSMNPGSDWTEVKTGVATDSVMNGAALNDICILVASGIAPQKSSAGSTLVDLTGSPPALAKYCRIYSSKLFLAGNPNDRSRVDFSASNDPEDFTTADNAGYIEIEKDDGDQIRGLETTKRALYVFKRRNVYAVTGTTTFDFSVDLLCSWGLVSEQGMASDGGGCFFASDDGIYYTSGLKVARISDKMRDAYLSISDKSTICLEVKGEKLFCSYDSDGDGINDKMLVCAFKRMMPDGSVQGVWGTYDSQGFQVMGAGRDYTLYALTNASTAQVWELDDGDSDAQIQWDTPDCDFGDQYKKKKFARFYVIARPASAGTTTITAQPFADGVSVGSSYSLEVSTAGSYEILQESFKGLSTRYARHWRIRLTVSQGPRTIYGWQMTADMPDTGIAPRR